MPDKEDESARLTQFLTTPSRYGNGKSPIQERVEAAISVMASEIANEVVKENPGLKEAIKNRAKEVVFRALRDDSYLNSTITNAIAKVLTEHALSNYEE